MKSIALKSFRLILCLLLSFSFSCKTKRTVATNNTNATSISTTQIIQNHYQKSLAFNTINGKIKLEGEYFDGDFSYLSNILGTDIDFKMAQNLLLGDALLDLREDKYNSAVEENSYRISPQKGVDLYKILFFINPDTYKIASQQLSQPKEKRFLDIKYTYQNVENRVLPSTVSIDIKDEDDASTITIDYQNIAFDENINFPYKIPKGLDEIKQ